MRYPVTSGDALLSQVSVKGKGTGAGVGVGVGNGVGVGVGRGVDVVTAPHAQRAIKKPTNKYLIFDTSFPSILPQSQAHPWPTLEALS